MKKNIPINNKNKKINKLKTGTDLSLATKFLKNSGVVAFPTETVYGLGADAKNLSAIKKIFEIKKRPLDHPLIVHISDLEKLKIWAIDIPPIAIKLAKHFWPGPLTLILKKRQNVFKEITGGQDTIAIRMPNHKLTLELLKNFDGLVGPSANKYGTISPTTAKHVLSDFGNIHNNNNNHNKENRNHYHSYDKNENNEKNENKDNLNNKDYYNNNVNSTLVNLKSTNNTDATETNEAQNNCYNIDYILDGGPCAIGIESTIVHCNNENFTILRQGSILSNQIKDFLNKESTTTKINITTSPPIQQKNQNHQKNCADKTKKILNGKKNCKNCLDPQYLSTQISKQKTFINTLEKLIEALPNKSSKLNKLNKSNKPNVPGNKESHYAPKTPLYLIEQQNLISFIENLNEKNLSCAILSFKEKPKEFNKKNFWLKEKNDYKIYAKNLYKNLRKLDTLSTNYIIIEAPTNEENWSAINDRLKKASLNF